MSTPKKFELKLAGGRKAGGQNLLTVRDPGTEGDIVATIETVNREDVMHALDSAEKGRKAWEFVSADERAAKLLQVALGLEKRADEIARWITLENGKPLAQARGEVMMAADHFRWFAAETRRIYGRVVPSQTPEKRHFVIKSPVGVVGAISPWNFPLALSARKVAPALAAGCPVVLKPASATPICALLMAECTWDCGIPDSALQVVVGEARMIADAFVEHKACKKITFTGSTEIGVKLAQSASGTMTKLSLELGGNAPLLIFADADMNMAVEEALKAKFRNTGQSCIASNRLYVEESIAEEFTRRFVERVRAMKVAHGLTEKVDIGAMINTKAVDEALETIDEAVRKGAKILCGGTRAEGLKGAFLAPTVLGNVPNDAGCMHKEIFAPVAPISTFKTEEEAIRLANDTEYGLSAYVFTSNLARTWRVAEALEAGTVGVNDGAPTVSQCPFGGYKWSGLGRELGSEGLDSFLETKHVSIRVA